MAGNHAIIAPSSLDRTVACAAWVQLAQDLPPEPDTPETLEGNAADWVAKQYAQGIEVPYGAPTPVPGYTVDYDMIHGAKLWRSVLRDGCVSGVPVDIPSIHPTDCWGEPDGWHWDPVQNLLTLPDYKYGFLVVDVFECWQLIGYASGIIDTLGLNDQTASVEFVIVQPRAFHKDGPVRRWRVRASALRPLINIANDAAMRAWPPAFARGIAAPPKAETGPHCLYCPARVHCRTLHDAATSVAHFVGTMETVALDAKAVGVELAILQQAATLLRSRVEALEQQAESYLRAGQPVPNYQMTRGQSRLEWNPDVTADELLALADVLGANLRRPPVTNLNARSGSPVVTPTQAVKAGLAEAVVAQYASRPPAAMTLERVDGSELRRAFGG